MTNEERQDQAKMLRAALGGEGAFAPVKNILEGLGRDEAMTRPPGLPYSIAEVVAHMDFWQGRVLTTLETDASPPQVQHAVDSWQPATWPLAAEQFLNGLARLNALSGDAGILSRSFGDESGAAHIYNVALHNAHHLGQVVALRRLAGAWPPPSGGETW